MILTISKNNEKLFEIDIEIKAFKKLTDKDKKKINKIALLLDSLGSDVERSEEEYRFAYDIKEDGTLLDVQYLQ